MSFWRLLRSAALAGMLALTCLGLGLRACGAGPAPQPDAPRVHEFHP